MGTYLDDLWNDLEQTWDLAMKVNDLSEEERSDVTAAWTNVFKPSELVDASRTESEGEAPPQKVFCTNIYGLQYNTETKYWVPFRHGDIDLAKFTED
ncbi:MAG: hypothetical protein HOL85_11995 [Rhodospirillaceae bacterium]|jgi:hypothetical protein|nr:hypothetical protein [Rhodospirillaceae bacterium]MBT6137351.1 hypothetical protein [Rhodospirillaceae bacterium]